MREQTDEWIKTSISVSDGVSVRLHDSGQPDDPLESDSGLLYNKNNKKNYSFEVLENVSNYKGPNQR